MDNQISWEDWILIYGLLVNSNPALDTHAVWAHGINAIKKHMEHAMAAMGLSENRIKFDMMMLYRNEPVHQVKTRSTPTLKSSTKIIIG